MVYENLDLGGEDPAQLTMYYDAGPIFVPSFPIPTLDPDFCVPERFPPPQTCVLINGVPHIGINFDEGWVEIRTPSEQLSFSS